ncbi:MAG: putative toxin-antitoxin system toxin component, PIN family, partial [Microcystaceae cyanobacterium]
YKSVLVRPKFKLTQEVILEWWEILETIPSLIEVDKIVNFPRDSKDAKFLACALVSKADFLITGDTDFAEVENLGNTKIISASEFKYLVIDPISDEKNRLLF